MPGLVMTPTLINSQGKQLRTVFDRSKMQAPTLWPSFFPKIDSDNERSFFQLMQVYGLGYFQFLSEGGSPALDQGGEGPITFFPKVDYALKYGITRPARKEDPHKINARLPRFLKFAKLQTQEQLYWNILTQSFNTAFPIWDGQPLCSQSHALAGTPGQTFSNYLGNVALTVESYQAARVLMATLPDDRQLAVSKTPVMLVSTPGYERIVEETIGSKYYPNSADNRINVAYGSTEPLIVRYIPTAQNGPFPWWLSAAPGEPGENAHGSFVVLADEGQHTWYDNDTDVMYHKAWFRTTWGSHSADGLVGSAGA